MLLPGLARRHHVQRIALFRPRTTFPYIDDRDEDNSSFFCVTTRYLGRRQVRFEATRSLLLARAPISTVGKKWERPLGCFSLAEIGRVRGEPGRSSPRLTNQVTTP